MLKEFQEFIQRGNVMELAVGIIIGAAFTSIVDSLVGDVITPAFLNPVMSAVGAENLAGLEWAGIKYGNFLSAVISFLIIAWVVFLLVKAYNGFMERFSKPEEVVVEEAPRQEALLEEIRDLLARNQQA